MVGGFRIGRLFGIQLTIDWSWVFIFVLMTWNLFSVFAEWHPSWSPLLALSTAAVASLAFFGSVLLHELAHALVAIAHGLRVKSITLFLFGGVSNIEREPPSPKVEFLTAIAGPVMSIGLGMSLLVLGMLITGATARSVASPAELMVGLGPVTTLIVWLGPINVLVGLFNLVPGFPLDGGRVLRSAIWAATGNMRIATRWATGVGQALGWTMIVAGIAMAFGARVPFFGTGVVGGLWLAFIGWFLNGAASQSYARMALEDVLAGVTVGRIMRTDFAGISADLRLDAFVNQYLMASDERAFPVFREDRMVGLVCLADVRKWPLDRWEATLVSDAMTPANELVVSSPDEPASEAMAKLTQLDVAQLPVLQNGRMVGLIRRRDIARWLELRSQGGAPMRPSFAR